MYTIKNDELSISILDPQADLERCGSRYCVGGYIYQVTDATAGPLFTGPQYPDPRPDTFDGQGAPDMFLATLGGETAAVGGEVGIIGVGRVRRTSPIEPFQVRHNPDVIEFLPWDVEQTANSITMRTEQIFADWAYRLERHMALDGRTITSRTDIHSTGEAILPVRWFPHPFFPLTADRVYCRFSIPVSLPETPGYFINADGFICQQPDFDWKKSCYVELNYEATGDSVTIEQRHPTVEQVTTAIDYMPVYLPVWSNDRTFSFEPYFAAQLASGKSAAWTVVYRF